MFAERLAEHKKVTDAEAEKVREVGGLFIPRNRAARVPPHRQPAARPRGRQGDPGESRFYIAMTDDIMRLFGSGARHGHDGHPRHGRGHPLDQKMLSNAIEQAQKTVESRNFQTRKNVLEYDDVMNVQRNVIYDERRKVLDGEGPPCLHPQDDRGVREQHRGGRARA